MTQDIKLVSVRILLEVGTYSSVNPEALAKAFIKDTVGDKGKIHHPHFRSDLYGSIEVHSIKVEDL
jgi:Zn finger protein HypA/HybF involved in hydrogenase expression